MSAGSEIKPFDLKRLIVGDVPWSFLLEVALRGVFVYLLLMISMRLLGKRVAAQLSLTELAVIVTLGAAVGVPMQAPERGILPAIILLGVAIAFEQGTNRWAFRRRNVEMLTQGDLALLAEDGRLRVDVMKREGISRERVFAALRASGIEQIGQVRCVYLEASGQFSLFRAAQRRPGLSLFPARDAAVRAMQPVAFGAFACGSCGYVERHERTPDFRCRYCGSVQWTPAVWDVQESSSNADADGGPNDQRLTERKKSQGPPQSARQ